MRPFPQDPRRTLPMAISPPPVLVPGTCHPTKWPCKGHGMRAPCAAPPCLSSPRAPRTASSHCPPPLQEGHCSHPLGASHHTQKCQWASHKAWNYAQSNNSQGPNHLNGHLGPCRVWAGEQPVTAPGKHLHLMREPSLEAEKMNLSSGEMTRQVTGSWCPRSTRILAGSGGRTCSNSRM